MLSHTELYESTLEQRATWNEEKIAQWFKQRRENRKRNLDAICSEYAQGVESRKQLINN